MANLPAKNLALKFRAFYRSFRLENPKEDLVTKTEQGFECLFLSGCSGAGFLRSSRFLDYAGQFAKELFCFARNDKVGG